MNWATGPLAKLLCCFLVEEQGMKSSSRPQSNLGINEGALFGFKGLLSGNLNPKKRGISAYPGSEVWGSFPPAGKWTGAWAVASSRLDGRPPTACPGGPKPKTLNPKPEALNP